MSVAAVQQHLHASDGIDQIEIGSYLSKLCAGLTSSMIGDAELITIKLMADAGRVKSAKVVTIGLIVTELVINEIKYAFPTDKCGALIVVTYEIGGSGWKLVVCDNGVGKTAGDAAGVNDGLGTTIVKALVKQLDARMEVVSDGAGTSVSITAAAFTSHMPKTA